MVKDSFIAENEDFHRVCATAYSEEDIKSRTFCGKEIKINGTEDYINLPLNLICNEEICWDCQKYYQKISHGMFSSSDDFDGEYLYAIRAFIGCSDSRGFLKTEIIPADSTSDAKRNYSELYNSVDSINYYNIERYNNGQWETIVQKL